MKWTEFFWIVVGMLAAGWAAAAAAVGEPAGETAAEPESSRHLIYVHGRIVQEKQSLRPEHPRFGVYEVEQILDAFRERGFVVTTELRPEKAAVSDSADRLVAQVQALLGSGVPARNVTVVGASMGAAITMAAAARLANPDLRFVILGSCLSNSIRGLLSSERRAPIGHVLAIREQSDEYTDKCSPRTAPGALPDLVTRELVLDTGLSHGFLYRPLPEWVDPAVEWAEAR